MNERIRELALQTGYKNTRWNTTEEFEEFLDEFAELIALECAELSVISQYANTKSEYYEGFNEALIYVGNKIKEHFGIESDSDQDGWVCPKCGTDRTRAACPLGHSAAIDGRCPMVGTAR